MIVHERRQHPRRDAVRLSRGQQQEAVVVHRRVDRRAVRLPVWKKLIQSAGIDDRAGQDVRADLGAFLQHAYPDLAAGLGGELLQPDCRREACRSAPHNHDVILHRFACHGISSRRSDGTPIIIVSQAGTLP